MVLKLLQSRLFWLSLLAFAFLANAVWLFRHPVNGDVAFHLTTSERLNEGQRLYIDIGDQNFPLVYLLEEVLAGLAALLHVPPVVVLFSAVLLLVATASVSLFAAIRRSDAFEEMFAFLLVLLVVQSALYFNRYDVGQRDVAAGFGALILVSNAFLLLCDQALPAKWRYPLLLLASLMISLKPHFLAPWLLVNVMLAARIGVRRVLRAPEFWMSALASAAHVLLIALVYPTYWRIARMAIELYSAYDVPVRSLIFDLRFVFLAAAAAFLWKADRRVQDLARLSALGAVGFAIAVLQQGKDWPYHYAPAFFLAWVTAAVLAVDLLKRTGSLTQYLRLQPATAILSLTLLAGLWPAFREVVAAPAPIDPVEQFALDKARGKSLLPLSTDLWTGYPLIMEAHAKSALPESVLWMIPGLYRDQIKAAKEQTPARFHSRGEMNEEEKRVFDEVVDAMQRYRPAVIVLQAPVLQQGMGKLQFDFLQYFSMDDRFRAALANYAEGPSDLQRRVLYLRSR